MTDNEEAARVIIDMAKAKFIEMLAETPDVGITRFGVVLSEQTVVSLAIRVKSDGSWEFVA